MKKHEWSHEKNSNYDTDARDYNDNRTSEDNKAKTPDRRKIRRRRLQIFSAMQHLRSGYVL